MQTKRPDWVTFLGTAETSGTLPARYCAMIQNVERREIALRSSLNGSKPEKEAAFRETFSSIHTREGEQGELSSKHAD